VRAQLKKDASYEQDASKVEFNLPLKAHEKRQFSYDVTTNFGSNATRSFFTDSGWAASSPAIIFRGLCNCPCWFHLVQLGW
jgi:hypothetical protein